VVLMKNVRAVDVLPRRDLRREGRSPMWVSGARVGVRRLGDLFGVALDRAALDTWCDELVPLLVWAAGYVRDVPYGLPLEDEQQFFVELVDDFFLSVDAPRRQVIRNLSGAHSRFVCLRDWLQAWAYRHVSPDAPARDVALRTLHVVVPSCRPEEKPPPKKEERRVSRRRRSGRSLWKEKKLRVICRLPAYVNLSESERALFRFYHARAVLSRDRDDWWCESGVDLEMVVLSVSERTVHRRRAALVRAHLVDVIFHGGEGMGCARFSVAVTAAGYRRLCVPRRLRRQRSQPKS
jgi:hypothetical protein